MHASCRHSDFPDYCGLITNHSIPFTIEENTITHSGNWPPTTGRRQLLQVLSSSESAMRITSRNTTIAFCITSGVLIAAVAVVLNIGWIILNWREVVPLILGVIFFRFIIAGVILNTIFLVREVRRNEQQDSFLNAITHELKTPITSIRLYLETLQQRDVDEAQRREFYQIMLADTQRLMGTVEQVLRAARVTQKNAVLNRTEVEVGPLVQDAVELARSAASSVAAGNGLGAGWQARRAAECSGRSRGAFYGAF